MNDDLALNFLQSASLTSDGISKSLDKVITELNETNDDKKIKLALGNLIGVGKLSVFLECKLLYEYHNWWEHTEQDAIKGDNFFDYINAEFQENLPDRNTIERNMRVWHHIENKTLPEKVQSRPIADLHAIVAVLDRGTHKITQENWNELASAYNGTKVRAILRKIEKKEPTKGSYVLHLGREGELYVWHQGQRVFYGQVKLPNGCTDPIERRVIEKMDKRLKSSMKPILD